MVCPRLFALCIFAAGLRVQNMSVTSTSTSASHSTKITPPPTIWTGSPQNSAVTTVFPVSDTGNASVVPVISTASTSIFSKDISTNPGEEEITSDSSVWESTHTNPTTPGLLSASSSVHLTPMPEEHSSGSPATTVPAVGSQTPPLTSPQASASTPSSLSTSMPVVPSASITPTLSTSVSIQTTAAPMSSEFPTEEHSSGHIPTSHATDQPGTKEKTPQDSESVKVMCESETTTPFLIMQDVEHALSSGSIAAITVTVIAVVLLVFGVAAYLKIRHSSYGRLLDDHDYGSWGNYNNPLYDDS
ncbi:prostate androgen-regulated mucin-like protein 1 [Thomomys bottae]